MSNKHKTAPLQTEKDSPNLNIHFINLCIMANEGM